ncbi:single-stranded-DNA-specific exonuclease RecJ [Sideroxydans lithotrophicus]|uniref:Single-stranded-DNA-specific exonuclease RecJ n=1 Tax=Sideroxydans lithotrophicus (strain ES-1) TaxID=580332 RepID=D5CS06_SIDLE|nr:single-stranded-DNA-specific exonuclease RecJ [Sideroxydans lithotrophicus]ADE11742.1 single-stranded-DNA-specific exonuclease RecJ [Sideroxydans lithotrophicus ES-1]
MNKISQRPYPASTAAQLVESGIAPLLARIYAARGIVDTAQLDTDLKQLLPFSLLKNAERMASILADAIADHKRILIVADYDADGATACTVAMRGLAALGAKVEFIVPNRFEYGYGLTPEIVRLAAESKPDILLTVDNGIASVEGVAEANRLGIQVLVTDHHLPGDTLPDALCIVNPNQPGCTFPSKHLAGVGVMFYVLMALRAEMRERGVFAGKTEPNLGNLLDLVALGTVADVVKLDDNNRILVQQGLQRIRAGRSCAGIQALLRIARRPAIQSSSYELGFIVGPRLNAAGRLDDMSLGIRCLLTDDTAEAGEIATRLDALNHERRSIEADMQDSALAVLDNFDPADGYSLTLFNEDWHQGVIGILASRLKDKFHRPVIAFARAQTGELKGSGRSIAGLHLRDALDLISKRQPHLIQKFGGHAMAAGLSIHEEHLNDFRQAFETVAQELLDADALVKVISTDGSLDTHEFSMDIARDLQRQVWGQGFPEPLFEGDFRVQTQRVVGEKHLKLKLSSPAGSFDAIRFFSAEPAPEHIHAVYSLSVNEYNGSESLQLIVRHWAGG